MAALGLLRSDVKYFSEKVFIKKMLYTDIEFKDGHLLDVRQKYKYGVGQKRLDTRYGKRKRGG